MKIIIKNADNFKNEYLKVLEGYNWENVIQGDILHTSTLSEMPIGDVIIRFKRQNLIWLEAVGTIENCKCRHCYELAELV
jgi:hypothetical protein